MGSCCRRPARVSDPTSQDFCTALHMATPVSVEATGSQVRVLVSVPNGQRMSLSDAIKSNNCAPNSTVGLRLADIVIRGVARIQAAGLSSALLQTVGRQMPILLLKDHVIRLVPLCGTCKGVGCPTCNQSGFQP